MSKPSNKIPPMEQPAPRVSKDHVKITASPAEAQALVRRLNEASQAEAASQHATAVVTDLFTMFCDGKGMPGARLVSIEGTTVTVIPAAKQ